MSHPTESRIALAIIATALLISTIWILTDISADCTASSEPVWRYTSQGWVELAELTPPSEAKSPGLLDNVSPLVWGGIQVLVALAILISFAEESPEGLVAHNPHAVVRGSSTGPVQPAQNV